MKTEFKSAGTAVSGTDSLMATVTLPHLDVLEAESINIMREVVAESSRPAMLYSIGKDSSVMLRLAQKAFYPGRIAFPLIHVDTGFKFREMIEFRDRTAQELGLQLIVQTNLEAKNAGANPFQLGTSKCCGLLKTKALLDVLAAHHIDAAIGGARRDEEKSRAKERDFPCAILWASGTPRISGRNSGTSTMAGSNLDKACVCFRYRTGLSSMCGSTSGARKFRLCRYISPKNARCWCEATT